MFSILGKQTIIQLIGKTISTILGLFIVGLMTRHLGTTGFGEYTSVVTFLQFFGILIDFGLTMTLGRELGAGTIPQNKLVSNLISFRVITSTLAFIVAPALAWLLPYSLTIKLGITITSLAFWTSSISQSLTGVFQTKLKSNWLVIAELSGRLALLAGTAWVIYQNISLNGYFVALIVANLVGALITLAIVKKLTPFNWEIDTKIWKHLWLTTWPVAVTITLNLIYFKADTIILSLIRPVAEVGIYGAAYKVLEVLLILPTIIGGLVLPLAAQAYAQQKTHELTSLFQGTFDSLLAAGLAVISGCVILGLPLMTLIAGNNFAVAGTILGILSLATACNFIGGGAGYIIFAINQQKTMIPYYAGVALVSLIGYFIFIPKFTFWGAAWITVLSEALMAIANIAILTKHNIKINFKRLPKIILATIILSGVLLIPAPFIIKTILGIIVYFLAIYKMKLIPTSFNNSEIIISN